MNAATPEDDRLTAAMLALDEGLNRIAHRWADLAELSYEDPETFGAGHFVLYPHEDDNARFVIEEQYTGTDWSDDERGPTSWTWAAERQVRDPGGRHVWGVERGGEIESADFGQLLAEASRWVRRVHNRAQRSASFGAATRRQEPPTLRL